MEIQFWAFFLSSALALNIAPGPDLVYILTKTLSGGKRAGIVSILGLSAGAFIHVVLAVLGVSLILKSSVLAFTLVKLVGASYLLFLAYQSWCTAALTTGEQNTSTVCELNGMPEVEETLFTIFKQGVLVDLFNPKVALFFIAYLPAFLRDDAGAVSLQLFYLGVLVIFVAIIVETIYVIIGSKLSTYIKENDGFNSYIDRAVAIIFTLLAVRLIVSVNY